MSTQFAVSVAGNVLLIDTETGKRFDIAPAAADEAAAACEAAAEKGRSTVMIATVEGDACTFEGNATQMRMAAADLRRGAAEGRIHAARATPGPEDVQPDDDEAPAPAKPN